MFSFQSSVFPHLFRFPSNFCKVLWYGRKSNTCAQTCLKFSYSEDPLAFTQGFPLGVVLFFFRLRCYSVYKIPSLSAPNRVSLQVRQVTHSIFSGCFPPIKATDIYCGLSIWKSKNTSKTIQIFLMNRTLFLAFPVQQYINF